LLLSHRPTRIAVQKQIELLTVAYWPLSTVAGNHKLAKAGVGSTSARHPARAHGSSSKADRYEPVIAARESDVTLVMIDGNSAFSSPTFEMALQRQGERIQAKAGKRFIDHDKPDPKVVAITYSGAVSVLSDAMSKLPARVHRAPWSVGAIGGEACANLDARARRATRYRLRAATDAAFEEPINRLTGSDASRLELAAIQATPIGPVPLDKVCVEEDVDHAANLQKQMNVPADIKEGLRQYYPVWNITRDG
jgi:hypothetical protein